MSLSLLRRAHTPKRPQLSLFDGCDLAMGRVHECAGRGRDTFAMMIAALVDGPILWVCPARQVERLNPDGMRPYIDPARVLIATTRNQTDSLAVIEDALRCGSIPLILAHLSEYPTLTQTRRLHLATEQGGQKAITALLTPAAGGTSGVEGRWVTTPAGDGQWHLTRSRARLAPPASWVIRWRRGQIMPVLTHPPSNATKTSQKDGQGIENILG